MLRLVAWEQLTTTEAAAVVGIPAATARTRLHRARTRMRAALEVHDPPDVDDEPDRPVTRPPCSPVPRLLAQPLNGIQG